MGMNIVASPIAALPAAMEHQDNLNWQKKQRSWMEQNQAEVEKAREHKRFVDHFIKAGGLNSLRNSFNPETGEWNNDELAAALSIVKGSKLKYLPPPEDGQYIGQTTAIPETQSGESASGDTKTSKERTPIKGLGVDFMSTDGTMKFHFKTPEEALLSIHGLLVDRDKAISEIDAVRQHLFTPQRMIDATDMENPRFVTLSPAAAAQAKRSGHKIMTQPEFSMLYKMGQNKANRAEKKQERLDTKEYRDKMLGLTKSGQALTKRGQDLNYKYRVTQDKAAATAATKKAQAAAEKARVKAIQTATAKATAFLKENVFKGETNEIGKFTPNPNLPSAVRLASQLSEAFAQKGVSGEKIGAMTAKIVLDANAFADKAVALQGGEKKLAKALADRGMTLEAYRQERADEFLRQALNQLIGPQQPAMGQVQGGQQGAIPSPGSEQGAPQDFWNGSSAMGNDPYAQAARQAQPPAGQQQVVETLPDPSTVPEGMTATNPDTGETFKKINGRWERVVPSGHGPGWHGPGIQYAAIPPAGRPNFGAAAQWLGETASKLSGPIRQRRAINLLNNYGQ